MILKVVAALREHCENAKICVLSFRLPAKVARLFGKTNEAENGNHNYVSFRTFNNEKPIEVAISSKNFAPYATLSLTPMHSFSSLLM